jgi:hypothetical protein
LRTIAQRHDVSESRVRQILDDAGAQGYAPDRVKGADGKSYPATPTAAVIVSVDPPADEPPEEEQPVEADKPVQVTNSVERSRTPQQVLESARRGVASLRRLFDELLAGDFAEQLRQICDRHHVELANEENSASGGRKSPGDGANPVRKGDGDRTGSLRSPLACLSTLDAILADLALEVIQQ